MTNELSWLALAKEFEKSAASAGSLRAEWLAFDGNEDYGIWLVRPGGPSTDALRATFSLLSASPIAKLGAAPVPTPQPLLHFPDWGRLINPLRGEAEKDGRTIDLSDAVPYGLGEVDRDAVDACTRAWLEWLRIHSSAFRSKEGALSIGSQVYQSRSGSPFRKTTEEPWQRRWV